MHVGARRFSIFRTEPLNRYERGFGLAGVIYVHRISDKRFTGMARRNFSRFRGLCGDETLKNVILVTNMWTRGPRDINEAREHELSTELFKPALDDGAQLIRHYDTTQSAYDIIRRIMKNHPAVSEIKQELADEDRDIVETPVGQTVSRELIGRAEKNLTELEKVKKEIRQALEEKDEEMKQELEEQARSLRDQTKKIEKELKEKIRKDLDEMAKGYAAEKARMEAKMDKMDQEATEREQAEAEHNRQLTELNRRLRDTANTSAADQAKLKEEMKRLEDRAVSTLYVQVPLYLATHNG